jgi:hypothetical protein
MINFKYKRTRQWILFWILTAILLYLASLGETYASEEVFIWIGAYFALYVLYLVFCFFRTIFTFFLSKEDIEYGYSKKFDPKLRAPEIIRRLEDSDISAKKRQKLENELKIIIKEYKSIVGSRKKLEEERNKYLETQARKNKAFMDSIPKKQAQYKHGSISPKIKCPHCHEIGKVRRKVEKHIEESREKGVIGAVIGKKTVTEKGNITKFYCENCKTPWTA